MFKSYDMTEMEICAHLLKLFNPLSDLPILGASNSAINKDMMSKIWKNGDTII